MLHSLTIKTSISPRNPLNVTIIICLHLRFITDYPHGAASPGDERLSAWIRERWTTQGLDSVKSYWYNTLLSFPDKDHPSTVSLVNQKGETVFSSQIMEPDITPGSTKQDDRIPPFISFSPSGNVEVNAFDYVTEIVLL